MGIKSSKLLIKRHLTWICLHTHSHTHFLPRLYRLGHKNEMEVVCACVSVCMRWSRALQREHGIFGSRWMFLCLESPYQSNTHTNTYTHNLHSSIQCFLLLIKAVNLHWIQCTCSQIHTLFKRIFPFAQQTSSYLFSHLMPPLLADRWALENCCCLSEQDTSLSLSKWFI